MADTFPPEPLPTIRWVMGGQFVELVDDGTYDAQDVQLNAGFATPLHRHSRYAEHLYVVAGAFQLRLGDDHRALGPGESVTIPVGTPHSLAVGEGGAHALIVSRPAGFANVIRASGAATADNFDIGDFVRAAIDAGDEILAPPPGAAVRA